ncbi:MAG: VCBS repeat-containing protein [Chloroflexi bacterium]|nr:VCBS repeat-containing protein [Chloroflexota bacterium]
MYQPELLLRNVFALAILLFAAIWSVGCSQVQVVEVEVTAIPQVNVVEVTATPEPTTAVADPTSAPTPETTAGPLSFVDSGQRLGEGRSCDVSLGDLDGDGDLDAFVVNGMLGKDQSVVWFNDGGVQGGTIGTFTVGEQNMGYGMGVSLEDLDGDGDLDAFIVSWDDAGKVWLNDGDGIFVDTGQSLGDAGGWDVALGDLDGDGNLDALIAMDKANIVWLNGGDGAFTDTGQRLGKAYTAAVDFDDVDGDGDLDALTVGWNEPGMVWLNDGTGVFTDSSQALTPSYTHIHGMILGDMDGDGDLDAFMSGAPNQIWFNDGGVQGGTPGVFHESEQSLRSLAGDTVALGDLDGDGDLDIYLAVGDWTGSEDKIWVNDGGLQGGTPGQFTDSDFPLSDLFSSGVGLGDLDGDGDLDAFVVHGELGRDSGGELPNEVWLNETP